MAIAYDSFLPDILPYARNCPDPTIEAAIRLAVIELCEKTDIWQVDLDPISAIAEQYAYDLEPPSQSTVQRIVSITDVNGERLEPVTTGMLDQRSPDWRNQPGNPRFYIRQDEENQIWLAPPPSVARTNAFLLRVVLKPSITSTSCSNFIMTDFRDAICNRTIARLLSMPDRDWSNFKTAAVHYSMWERQVVDIEKQARQANEGVTPVVRYGGIGVRRGQRNPYDSRRTRFI